MKFGNENPKHVRVRTETIQSFAYAGKPDTTSEVSAYAASQEHSLHLILMYPSGWVRESHSPVDG